MQSSFKEGKKMARENRFVILLTEAERQVIETLAKVEKLPASTLARRRLLLEAENRGIALRYMEQTNEEAIHAL